MRTIYILINFTALYFIAIITQAQILNGDFEEWVNGVPANWFTKDSEFCLSSATNIFQTTKAYSGNFAVYGKVISAEDCEPAIRTYDNLENFTGFPISERPVNFSLQYIYIPTSEDGGGLGIDIYLMKGENVVGTGGGWVFNTDFLDTNYSKFKTSFTYYNDLIPDVIVISIGLVDNDVGSEFYIDDLSLSYIGLVAPLEEDVVISGEKENIRWESNTENVILKYSVDDGASYSLIYNNYPADSNKYTWEVPSELLSTEGILRIEDPDDVNNNDEISVNFKPWQLTRINDNDEFELFEPDIHGWKFCNCEDNMWPLTWWEQFNYFDDIDPNTNKQYPNIEPFKSALSDDFPDWPIFVNTFGANQCYTTSTPTQNSYRSRATTLWASIKDQWGGSCEGFAVSSLLHFYHKNIFLLQNPNIGTDQNLYTYQITDNIRKSISKYFIHQFAEPYSSYEASRFNSVDARQTLQELKDMFEKKDGDGKPLGFYNNNGSGGHAVTPYKLDRIDNSSIFNLRVYDSNHPGSSGFGIRIDSAANTWTELTGLGWGTGTTGCLLGIESKYHFFNTGLPKNVQSNILTENIKKISLQSSDVKIFNSSNAAISIKTPDGIIGYSDSSVINTTSNSFPIIPKTGTNQPPIGYFLSSDNCEIQVSNFKDSRSYIFFMDSSKIINYRRYDANLNQKDILTFSNGLSFKNTDQVKKKISLETIMDNEIGEKVFVIDEFEMINNDSLYLNDINRENLLFRNFGETKNYNLQIRSADLDGARIFNHENIFLENNSSHQIVPEWQNLEMPIKILIDKGNNGSIDDSIFVSNEITGIEKLSEQIIPNQFVLSQNYPNPFNPTTTIKYSIPKQTNVSLKVFDILGNEIITLVNKELLPGNYEVDFSGSDLTSGIYFYRLQAGSFVETKKMILMK